MTTHQLKDKLALTEFWLGEEKEVEAGYCGDLLSWAMSKAPKNSAWVTVMTNNNVAAVTVLCDVACVILAQGAKPDEQLKNRMMAENVCLFGSELDAFSIVLKLGELLEINI